MKKLYIPILSIISFTQHIQSMEQQQVTATDKDKDEYCEILRNTGSGTVTRSTGANNIFVMFPSRYGCCCNIPKTIDFLSLKLYNRNLNETEIENLVHQGANVNHKDPVFFDVYNSIAMYHARNDTEQGVKNMAQLIKHGINLHNNRCRETPLTIAAQKNNTDMIKLLLPHELLSNEKSDEESELLSDEDDKVTTSIKKTVVRYAFDNQNIEVIEALLDLNIITPDEGWEKFADRMTPNQEILDLLYNRKATCSYNTFAIIMARAFPSKSYIKFLEQTVTAYNIDNPEALEKLYAIQTMVKNSIESLERNQAHQSEYLSEDSEDSDK